MVSLLFCYVPLLEEVADDFNVSDNDASTCVVEEAKYPSSYAIFIFAANFLLSAALIINVVR